MQPIFKITRMYTKETPSIPMEKVFWCDLSRGN